MKEDINESVLQDLSLEKGGFSLLIARMVPENSVETILKGFVASPTKRKFLVIGNTNNKYGQYIKNKFSDPRIIYLGYISGIDKLNILRKTKLVHIDAYLFKFIQSTRFICLLYWYFIFVFSY